MFDFFEQFKLYTENGLSVGPIRRDGTKAIALKKGEPQRYHEEIAPLIRGRIWSLQHVGLCVFCGLASQGLEVIDIDNGDYFEPFRNKLGFASVILEGLPIIRTPKGWHIYYRCNEIVEGSHKFAKTADGKTIFETKGHGGYVVAPGNPPDVHPSGKTYDHHSGPRLPFVPSITGIERRTLLDAAMSFDQYECRKRAAAELAKKLKHASYVGDSDFVVGPNFKARADWHQVLTPHGWRFDGEYWVSPQSTSGRSAKVNQSQDGESVLTVFGANSGPLSPDGDYKNWDLFSAYAALNHNGNRTEAAKQLAREGYAT